jgi:peptidoglycan L-alanyl-D-glutamate endopeptidase CwlK
MAADSLTLERIATMHPKVRQEVLDMYTHANEKILGKGVRLRFAYTYRTNKEQDALYNQKPKVTNAKGGESIHNYGLAFDIVLLLDKDGNGTFETATWDTLKDFDKDGTSDWMEVVKYFKSKGWSWGGDWKFKDYPHFEKTFGHSWQQLQKAFNNGKTTSELISGIEYNWVNLQ